MSWRTRAELREYYGTAKVLAGQGAQDACDERLHGDRGHLARPILWMEGMELETVEIKAVTGVLLRRNALATEAILIAKALAGHVKARGGPWSGPHLSSPNRGVAEHVRVLVAAASSPQAARGAVMEYGLGLPAENPLRWHLEDKDRGAPTTGRPLADIAAERRRRRCGPSGTSGHHRRSALIRDRKLKAGSDTERRMHRGVDAPGNRKRETDKRSHRSPGPLGVRRRPAAA